MGKKFFENQPNFSIVNEKGLQISTERFFGVSSIPRRVVILGTVIEGEINRGQSIQLSCKNGKSYPVVVKKIERWHREISYAVRNEQIGIEIYGLTIQQLRLINDSVLISQLSEK